MEMKEIEIGKMYQAEDAGLVKFDYGRETEKAVSLGKWELIEDDEHLANLRRMEEEYRAKGKGPQDEFDGRWWRPANPRWDELVWLPKSQIEWVDEKTMRIPEWLYEKRFPCMKEADEEDYALENL